MQGALSCDDDIEGAYDPESPRVYPHMMFKLWPSPFIAEFAQTQLHSARARENNGRVNVEGLGCGLC